MDPKSYARLYEGESADAQYFNTRLGIVLEMLGSRPAGRALDAGCGPGVTVRRLIDREWSCVGLDISQEMVAECREALGDRGGADFVCGSVEEIPFGDEAFDAVLAMGVLEYVREVNGAIRELARVTKQDGLAVLTMMNRLSPYRVWERKVFSKWTQLCTRRKPTPSWIYSEREFRGLCEGNGLEVQEVAYYDFNLLPTPLDKKMPVKAAKINRACESLCRGHLRWIGTGFIVKARKK